jgi:hypothetical protein
MLRRWLAGLVVLVGCGHSRTPAVADGSAAIDAPGEAIAHDAPIDAMLDGCSGLSVDGAVAVASPKCTTTPTTLLDVSPAFLGNIAMLGGTLYAATYTLDQQTGMVSSAAVLAVNPATGASTPVLVANATLSVANGAIYASDYGAGTLDQISPDGTIARILTGHPHIGVVTTDDTYVYWTESSGAANGEIYRMPKCGGAIDDLFTCADPFVIALDDTYIYCGNFSGSLLRAGKDGSNPTVITGTDGYPIDGFSRDGTTLYYSDLDNDEHLRQVPLPDGPAVAVAAIANPDRVVGIATSDTDVYVAAFSGIYQVDKVSAAVTHIVDNIEMSAAPIVSNGELFLAEDTSVIGRCID